MVRLGVMNYLEVLEWKEWMMTIKAGEYKHGMYEIW